MAGKPPDFRTYVKDTEGKLVDLTAEWKQSKGHLTGKITVTEELATLFKVGAEIPVISFPNTPKAKAAKPAETAPAA